MSDEPCEVCGRPKFPPRSGRGPEQTECFETGDVECGITARLVTAERDLAAARRQLEEARGLLREERDDSMCISVPIEKVGRRGGIASHVRLCPAGDPCWWCRVDAFLAPPAASPPPATDEGRVFQASPETRAYIAEMTKAWPIPIEPAATPPACASWCGTVGVPKSGKDCVHRPGSNACFCTPACRDAGAPRNPEKPCDICHGTKVVPVRNLSASRPPDVACPRCVPG